MFFNANGLTHRLDDIHKFSHSQSIDLILVAETHLLSEFSLPGLLFQIPAYKGPGGGIIGGILGFSRSPLQIRHLQSNSLFSILDIAGDSLLAVGYFPPSLSDSSFKARMVDLLETLRSMSNDWQKPVFVVGDFNARHSSFGDHSTLKRGTDLYQLLQDFPVVHCKPETTQFTTVTSTGGKGVTDLLLCSQAQLVESLTVFENESLGGSDHRPIVWTFNPEAIHETYDKRQRWNLHRFIKEPSIIMDYQQELIRRFPSDLFSSGLHLLDFDKTAYVDQVWHSISSWLSESLENSCGYSAPFRNHQGMFWTPDLLKDSERLNELANTVIEDPAQLQAHLEEKRTLFRRYAQNREKRHKELHRVFLDEICKSGNQGQFFRYVKRINRKRARSELDPSLIDSYSAHFSSTFGGAPAGSASLIDDSILETTDPFSGEPSKAAVNISFEDVEKVVFYRLGRNKVAGIDGIPAEAYIYGGPIVMNALSQFFNLLVEFQRSPSQWNESLMTVIYKNKGDPENIKNYRPISLTVVAKRIFEKIIDSKLDVYKAKLHDLQGGFRKGRSTLHQVYYLAELMKKNKKNIVNVYMDLRAAYDTVDRRLLWTYLATKFGMPLELIRLLRAFFDHNQSYLLVGDARSSPIKNLRGLPQGSSLSPTLFNFFINILIELLQRTQVSNPLDSKCLFFADDANLHAKNSQDMQTLLDVCDDWARSHGMQFAPDKCFVVANSPMTLNLDNTPLSQVESTKYLGIFMASSGPDWTQMASVLALKAKNVTMALIRIGFNKKTWAPSAKIDVYKLFIRPLLEYGMQINLYDSRSTQLFEKTQQLALRIAYGVPWNTSKTALKRLSCLESVKSRNHLLNAKFLWKLKTQADDTLPAFKTFRDSLDNNKSLTYEWRKFNQYYHRLINLSTLSIKKEIKLIRQENIEQDDMGHTNVSSAIPVNKNLARSAILSWTGIEDMTIKLELIQWRLGRIAFHQDCQRCGESLSRKHAVICSGAEEFLDSKFPDIQVPASQTIIDAILNKFFNNNVRTVFLEIFEAIQGIRKACLLQTVVPFL
jgi:hypothetical protein